MQLISFRKAFPVMAIVVFLLACTTVPIWAQGLTGTGKVLAAASKDYDPKTDTGASIPAGASFYFAKNSIVVSSSLRSWWVNITANIMTYSDYKATFDGMFQNVTFSVYLDRDSNIYVYDARDGVGTAKNEKGEVIAEGHLRTLADWLAIPGKAGATFRFEAYGSPVKARWSDGAPEDFALLSLNSSHEWTIKDDHFSFLADVADLDRLTLFVRLPESITRAAIITVPKGEVELFGYKITAPLEGAKVRFQKGAVIECAGCTSTKLAQ